MAGDEEVRLTLRLPESLRDKLQALSKTSGRSVNAEIVQRLESSIGFEDEYGPLEQVMREVWSDIDKLKEKVQEHEEHLFPNRYDWK